MYILYLPLLRRKLCIRGTYGEKVMVSEIRIESPGSNPVNVSVLFNAREKVDQTRLIHFGRQPV